MPKIAKAKIWPLRTLGVNMFLGYRSVYLVDYLLIIADLKKKKVHIYSHLHLVDVSIYFYYKKAFYDPNQDYYNMFKRDQSIKNIIVVYIIQNISI
jgi:hypothetical protein